MNTLGNGNEAAKMSRVSTHTTDRPLLSELPGPDWQYDHTSQIVIYGFNELRPHPSYVRLGLSVPVSKLSALVELGELAFREPLAITHERIILDGYARWELARMEKRLALPCLEYTLTEEEALRWLIQKHRRSNGINDFCRILLALELEPHVKAKALSNQRFGGRMKGSSNLTEDARLDVREEIATAAGVSTGNVNKVKQLVRLGQPELLEALRGDEVSIHQAWKWSTESPEQQIEALRAYQAEKGVNKSIRDLISRQKQTQIPTVPDLGSLAWRLARLQADESNSVRISVIRAPGKMLVVTEELLQSLRSYQESMPLCTDNR